MSASDLPNAGNHSRRGVRVILSTVNKRGKSTRAAVFPYKSLVRAACFAFSRVCVSRND